MYYKLTTADGIFVGHFICLQSFKELNKSIMLDIINSPHPKKLNSNLIRYFCFILMFILTFRYIF